MASQILLLSQPRSGSHFLERMLTNQSNVKVLAHPFSASRGKQVPWLLRDDYANGMEAEESRDYEDGMRKEVGVWEDALDDAAAARLLFVVHSHPFFPVSSGTILQYMNLLGSSDTAHLRSENFTLVPDSLLLRPGTIPVISIRDPRLCVPSTYRVLDRMNLPHGGGRAFFLVTTCNIWNCVLYNFYKAHGVEPIVVDADDYMTSESFVRSLCVKVGLDPAQALFEWTKVTAKEKEEDIHPMLYASQNTLYESSGVIAGRAAKNCDLVGEAREWEDEFGEDVGLLREMAALAEPHYRYLYERRWKGEA